jgi:hypothetical protein
MRLSTLLVSLVLAALLASCAGTSTPATTATPTAPAGERTATAPRALPPPPPHRPVRQYEPGTDPASEARLRTAVQTVEAADLELAATQLK